MSDWEEYYSGGSESDVSDSGGSMDVSSMSVESDRQSDENNRTVKVLSKSHPRKRAPRTMDIHSIHSTVTKPSLAAFRKKANISSEFKLRVPQEHERILFPPPGYFTSYEAYFEAGFFLPPPQLFVDILHSFGLCPSQLTPNSFLYYWGFVKQCQDFDLPLNIEYFHTFFFVKLAPEDNYFHFFPRPGLRFLSSCSSSWGPWKEKFFFVKNDNWNFLSLWASSTSRVKVSKSLRERVASSGILDETYDTNLLFTNGKMVNVKSIMARRDEKRENENSLRKEGVNHSSFRPQPPKTVEEGSSRRQPPLASKESAHPRSRPKGLSLDAGLPRVSGAKVDPSKKRNKSLGPEMRPGKGKPLCPHLLNIDSPDHLWSHLELGEEVSRHSIRKADVAYLQPFSAEDLVASIFCDMARVPAAVHFLGAKTEAYEEMHRRAEKFENQCRSLTREISQLQLDRDATLKQLEDELSKVRKELKDELASGKGYHETLGGQRFLLEHGDKRVLEFKQSAAFEEALEEASIPVFDECLTFLKERLINSGRFPGEDFKFLDSSQAEMIDTPLSGNIAAAQASQGTCLMDIGDDVASP